MAIAFLTQNKNIVDQLFAKTTMKIVSKYFQMEVVFLMVHIVFVNKTAKIIRIKMIAKKDLMGSADI